MNKKILIAAIADLSKSARPQTFFNSLSNDYDVSLLGLNSIKDNKKDFISLPNRYNTFLSRQLSRLLLSFRFYSKYLYFPNECNLIAKLNQCNFDAIVCHDLFLLPLLSKLNDIPIIFDAREYYPRHFEDRLIWRLFHKKINEYLCHNFFYLPDHFFTVSEGIAQEYSKNYNVDMEVLYSLSRPNPLSPMRVDPQHIRMVYHGAATPSRKIENMIELMDFTDERFSLDLYLVKNDLRYFSKLEKIAKLRKNVSIKDPVAFDRIITETNQYDIGLFFCPPTTTNLKYCMPNKLFEYLQSRLAIASGPLPDINRFLESNKVGILSDSFSPKSMAIALNKLSINQLTKLKQNSHIAAQTYNSNLTKKRILEVVNELI